MLQNLHDIIKGWIAKVIFILIAITFAVFGTQNYYSKSGNTDVKAEVNGDPITDAEVRDTYRRLVMQVASDSGKEFTVTPELEQKLKQEALNQLIQERVLQQKAAVLGFYVSIPQAEQILLQIPAFQEDGKFSKEKFQQVIHSAMYTPESYIHQLQRGLLTNQVQAGFVATEFSLPADLQRANDLIHQARDFRYLSIPSSGFAKNYQPPLEAQKAYYEKEAKLFTIPEKVKLEYVTLSVPVLMAREKISDDAVKNYYSSNAANYQSPARWEVAHILLPTEASEQAEALLKQIRSGEDFGKLAKQYSMDKLSAVNGGALPTMSGDNLPKTLAPTIMSLNETGQVVGPVVTPYGLEIVKCVKFIAPRPIPFEQVKNSIRESLMRDKAQQQFANLSEELANLSYQNPESLSAVEKKLSLPIQTSDWLSRDGKTDDKFAQEKKIQQAAFSEDVLHNRNNSEVIQISDDAVAVIRIKEQQPAVVKPFDTVQSEIVKLLSREEQKKQAGAFVDQFIGKLQQQQSVNDLIKAHSLSWVNLVAVERNSTKAPIELVRSAFSMSPPTEKQPSIQGLALKNGDYAIVQLQGITQKSDSTKLTSEQRQILRTSSESDRGMMAYQLLLKSIQDQASIKVH